MSRSGFSSARERRLWVLVALVVVAIWATLGLAGSLAATLRASGLLSVAFLAAFVLTLAAIAAAAWSRRPHAAEAWTFVGIAAVYGMIVVRMGVPLEERTHLFEYGLVAVLVHAALRERKDNGRAVPAPVLLAIAITAAFGWVDEGIQWLLPGRFYDLRDVLFNLLAAVMTVSASVLLRWVRDRFAP